MMDLGMRATRWDVCGPGLMRDCVHIHAQYRDRWGNRWYFGTPIANELAEELPAMTAMLLAVWREFRYAADRRYDSPFAFWPSLREGRWAA